MSLISIVDVNANTAYALDAKQTIDDKKKSRADLYADHIESVFDQLKSFAARQGERNARSSRQGRRGFIPSARRAEGARASLCLKL
jgi:hypothetical protein